MKVSYVPNTTFKLDFQIATNLPTTTKPLTIRQPSSFNI